MYDIRLAQKGEIIRQKEIWKHCFGDPDNYIDFYYAHRYKEEETAVLLYNHEILAMLTMIPVKTVFPDRGSINTAMLYAIATHPRHQKKGIAAQLMEFSNQYLKANDSELSVLVPANRELFNYYRKQGYQDGFYLRETSLNRESVVRLPIDKPSHCVISTITSEEYNHRRQEQLRGRHYISYANEDIAYQKKLALATGTDIYAIDMDNVEGCFTAERASDDKLLIKEILFPDDLINLAIKHIARQLPAKDYVIRLPAFKGQHLGGSIRPFGMIKVLSKSDLIITSNDQGYLGFAFD